MADRRNFANCMLVGLTMCCVGFQAAGAAEAAYEYYCPRTNTTFVGEPKHISVVSGPYVQFPRKAADIDKPEERLRKSAEVGDCSNSEFKCIRIEPGAGLAGFYVFAPRRVELGRVYHFNGMEAVTAVSTASTSKTTMGQLTLWQRIDGREIPIVLTLKAGAGVVYLDGFEFWNSLIVGRQSATCVSVSSRGLFADVTLALPAGEPKPVM